MTEPKSDTPFCDKYEESVIDDEEFIMAVPSRKVRQLEELKNELEAHLIAMVRRFKASGRAIYHVDAEETIEAEKALQRAKEFDQS